MSDIIVTSKNLSRFNKRLQKELQEYFKQDVPLHIASKIFAKSLGAQNEYDLKHSIEQLPEKSLSTLSITPNEIFDKSSKISQAKIKPIENYGQVYESFLVVDNDYFEVYGAPYVLDNSLWAKVEEHHFKVYPNFEEALCHRHPHSMIIQNCKKLDQVHNKHGICSYYLYEDVGELYFNCVDQKNPFHYKDLNDLYRYEGWLAKNVFDFREEYNPYAINDPERKYWIEGYELENKQKKLKVKK